MKHKIINLNKIINQEIKIIHKQTKITKTKTKLTIKIIPHQHKQIKIAQLKTYQVVKTIHKIKITVRNKTVHLQIINLNKQAIYHKTRLEKTNNKVKTKIKSIM
jgi:hypothetical protein